MTRICRCLITGLLHCLVLFCFIGVGMSSELRTLTSGQVMTDHDFLNSPNGWFRLRFFTSDSLGSLHYLGIECVAERSIIIWIANRENPLEDSSGFLNITQNGNIVISDSKGIILVINSTINSNSSSSLSLLNSGNLVLKAVNQTVWQSFDHLSDTWLPGMKLGSFGLNNHFLTSWRTPTDATPGPYTLGVEDPSNIHKQLVIRRNGILHWQSGIYDGMSSFYNDLRGNSFNFSYVEKNKNESYYTFSTVKRRVPIVLIRMDSTGILVVVQLSWDGPGPLGEMGPFPFPKCDGEDNGNSRGCVFPEPSNCRSGDLFSIRRGSLYASSEDLWWDYVLENGSLLIDDCKEICRNNCSCTAYSLRNKIGCRFSSHCSWEGVTLEDYLNAYPIYIRNGITGQKRIFTITFAVVVALSVTVYLVLLLCSYQSRITCCCFGGKERRSIIKEMAATMAEIDKRSGAPKVDSLGKNDHELPLFSFSTIQLATNNFSVANKLGQGGFGHVFKGKLVDGQEIAVKRLCTESGSGQGLEEFKNEIILLSRLQHRNLVRVLGCCIEGDERILVLEYLPNKSLDYFLFDATKRALLDWKKHMCIIEGIAQALLYLHKYSRLKIIHRDLKPSNVLLDSNMNPKISDFGTARIFREDESRANTRKVVGTYGYMSPEYVMDGVFSVKSDVFSFGIMMLEIVTGKKNTGFYQSDRYLNLIGYVWDLWKEGRYLELVHQDLRDETSSADEAIRCIHVGLLCVQENAADRPTMMDVLSMLNYVVVSLPTPKQSAFLTRSRVDNVASLQKRRLGSVNEMTISEMEGR